jgi:hypothetical protein
MHIHALSTTTNTILDPARVGSMLLLRVDDIAEKFKVLLQVVPKDVYRRETGPIVSKGVTSRDERDRIHLSSNRSQLHNR